MSAALDSVTGAADAPTPKRRFRGFPGGEILLVFIVVQGICVAAGLLFPDEFRYLASANLATLFKAVPILGVIALGVGILMISGEFDLSVGSSYVFSAIVMATAVRDGLDPYLGSLLALAVGVAIGTLNGVVTLGTGLPSFIVTLGTMLFWKGATLLYHGATPVPFQPSDGMFRHLVAGDIPLAGPYTLSASFLWFLGLGVAFHVLLSHHKLGNHFQAVGGNRRAAVAIGINAARTKLLAFALTGGCAALAGIIATARLSSIQPGQGEGLELRSIAACVIGGLALGGGRGTVLGIVLGTALTFTIQDVLLLLRAPGFYLDMFIGVLIVATAASNRVGRAASP